MAASSRAMTLMVLAVKSSPPLHQARAVAPAQPVSFTFNQNLYSASNRGLFAYSAQRGGLRTATGSATANEAVLNYNPPAAAPWAPSETVTTVLTTTGRGTSGPNVYLTRAQVRRFVSAVGGTGQGRSWPPPTWSWAAKRRPWRWLPSRRQH